jgi:hypothetical protein
MLKLATAFPFPLCVDFASAGTPIPIAATNATVAKIAMHSLFFQQQA